MSCIMALKRGALDLPLLDIAVSSCPAACSILQAGRWLAAHHAGNGLNRLLGSSCALSASKWRRRYGEAATAFALYRRRRENGIACRARRRLISFGWLNMMLSTAQARLNRYCVAASSRGFQRRSWRRKPIKCHVCKWPATKIENNAAWRVS